MSVSGGLLKVVGECSVDLRFPEFSVSHSFLFCRGLGVNTSAILGVDFLRAVSAVIDFPSNRILSNLGSVALEFQPTYSSLEPPVCATGQMANTVQQVLGDSPLETLVKEFADIMRTDGDFVGETTLIEHDITTNDSSDSGSSSSSSSSSVDASSEEESDVGEGGDEGGGLRRSTRSRRPPMWLRDFYT